MGHMHIMRCENCAEAHAQELEALTAALKTSQEKVKGLEERVAYLKDEGLKFEVLQDAEREVAELRKAQKSLSKSYNELSEESARELADAGQNLAILADHHTFQKDRAEQAEAKVARLVEALKKIYNLAHYTPDGCPLCKAKDIARQALADSEEN